MSTNPEAAQSLIAKAEPFGNDSGEARTKNKLNTINGCYIPCLLNILGAVLFLRVGFSVGQMGLWGALGIFTVSEMIAYVTITSFSAIVTNGRMAGGGAYFMISRNLGPAFGGSSGLLFWWTYCMNVTFNTVAFTQTVQPAIFPADSWWGQSTYYSQCAISSITLFILFLVAYKGAGAFAKVNYFIFAALVVALVMAIGPLYFSTEHITLATYTNNENVDVPINGSFAPFSLKRLSENMWPDPAVSEQCAAAAAFGEASVDGQVCNLQLVFAVIFPAVVGMMEGANLSGDLADPGATCSLPTTAVLTPTLSRGYSIPIGTIAAVSTAFLCYILLIVGQAGTMNREALQFDMNVMQHSTPWNGNFVLIGVTAACLSTALGSMFGSARILQAIARDEIFPGMSWFAKGTTHGDEPRNAIILSFLIAEFAILLGNLDDVAPILTNFFLLTYALVNLACFLLVTSSVPNFRPTYRVYDWRISLFGFMFIIFVMFYLQWLYALVAVLVVFGIYLYIECCRTRLLQETHDWADIAQGMLFKYARGALLSLQRLPKDFKYWRPSVLLLAQPTNPAPESFEALVWFVNDLKKGGLFVIGYPLVATQPSVGLAEAHTAQAEAQLEGFEGLKAFRQLGVGATCRTACLNLMLGSGLGTMTADTVVMPLRTERAQGGDNLELEVESREEYLGVLQDALALKKNILLTANFSRPAPVGGSIDIWIFGDVPPPEVAHSEFEIETTAEAIPLSLMLQLGQIAYTKNYRKGTEPRLRLCQLAAPGPKEVREARLQEWVVWARLPCAEVCVVETPDAPEACSRWEWLGNNEAISSANRALQEHSAAAATIFMLTPSPEGNPSDDEKRPSEIVAPLDLTVVLPRLVEGLPPTVLVRNGQGAPVITTVI